MKTQLIFLSLILITLTSCKRYYKVSNFDQISQDHQTIAILPFEIQITGHVSSELTPEIITKIEENESKAFQISFFNKILASTRRGKNPIHVKLQHFSRTMDLLNENDISIRESWSKDPSKLANMLGVDAVVKGTIEKQQYFSDGLSAGIELGTTIIGALGGFTGVPYISNNNKNVRTNYSLVDSTDGTVLWFIGYDHDADWRRRSDEMISNINRRSAKRFPYRSK